jgi:long-chain-fatty-acid---luciferin-component ligase
MAARSICWTCKMNFVARSFPRNSVIEALVFDEAYTERDYAAVAEARTAAILTATATLLDQCDLYAGFCERLGFRLEGIGDESELGRIPQLPLSVFKTASPRCSGTEGELIETTSSGTRGVVSRVLRDSTTLDRLLGGLQGSFRLVGEFFEDDTTVLHLGPSPGASDGVWMSYVMGLVELAFETRHFVHGRIFLLGEALDAVEECLAAGRRIIVLGPPMLAKALAEASLEIGRSFRGEDRLFFVTGGGWKRNTGRALESENFAALLCRGFNLASRAQVRDAFNQVELNTVLVECEAGRKHLPPWLQVIVRDFAALAPLPPGELGVLSFLDPTATSYPALFIGDDIGRLDLSPCACGRRSPSLHLLRRLQLSESRGCALRMDERVRVRSSLPPVRTLLQRKSP